MLFLASALAASVTFVAALLPPLHTPGIPDAGRPDVFPAPPGYLLPWPGGQIHTVTQGEETNFTHNGAAAYAFDFDLNYETIVAARSGRVAMVRTDSNSGGCNSIFSSSTNYVVIDHGDGTSAAYLHLAQQEPLVKPGDMVEQGQPIAISGETGVTCGGSGGPGPHLHFQVERTQEGQYFTQSVPIAFDDISTTDGIPQQDASYVSGNFGGGHEQTVKLTPHHVPREFNPIAQPADPTLMEAPPPPPPPAPGEPPAPASPNGAPVADTPSAVPSSTLTPLPSSTPLPTETFPPTNTPQPAATQTVPPATATEPPPTPTPAAPPSLPPAPSATPPRRASRVIRARRRALQRRLRRLRPAAVRRPANAGTRRSAARRLARIPSVQLPTCVRYAAAMASVELVIPCYNEQRVLADSIDRLRAWCASNLPYRWRIVVADNASTDETLSIARRLAEEYPTESGTSTSTGRVAGGR